jgi:hypothetical protein
MIADLETIPKCDYVGCEHEPQHWWYIKTINCMVERLFCHQHAHDARGNDQATFGDAYTPGSDEGTA